MLSAVLVLASAGRHLNASHQCCEPHPQLSFNGEARAAWVRTRCQCVNDGLPAEVAGLARGAYAHFHFPVPKDLRGAAHRHVTFWVMPCHGKVRLHGKPLMLRGVARDWAIRQNWTKDSLEKMAGKLKTSTGPIPYAGPYGLKSKTERLGEYIQRSRTAKQITDQQQNP